jgi:hypothetical protein
MPRGLPPQASSNRVCRRRQKASQCPPRSDRVHGLIRARLLRDKNKQDSICKERVKSLLVRHLDGVSAHADQQIRRPQSRWQIGPPQICVSSVISNRLQSLVPPAEDNKHKQGLHMSRKSNACDRVGDGVSVCVCVCLRRYLKLPS